MGKSKNISIRFDEEKTAFALLEEKIEKHQKLVDFLLEKYWWEKKIGINPVSERNSESKKDLSEKKKFSKPDSEVKQESASKNKENKYPDMLKGESLIDYKIRKSENK